MNRAILIFVVIVGSALPLGVWGSYRRMHPETSNPPPAREPQVEVVERETVPTPAPIPSTQVQPTMARPVPPAPMPVAVAPASPMPLNPERAPAARPKPPNLPITTVKVVPPPRTIRAKTVISVSDPTPVAVKKPVSRKPSSTRRRHRRR